MYLICDYLSASGGLKLSRGIGRLTIFSKGITMEYDEDKIDDYTLALMFLVTHSRMEGYGARAWEGFDWDTINRLHEKGMITNPIGKAKSVGLTEEGYKKAEELFDGFFKRG